MILERYLHSCMLKKNFPIKSFFAPWESLFLTSKVSREMGCRERLCQIQIRFHARDRTEEKLFLPRESRGLSAFLSYKVIEIVKL